MIQCFLISLADAPERRRTAVAALEAAGLPFRLIEAVDGRDGPNSDAPGFGRPMAGAEAACLQSHLAALAAFLDSDAPLCVILEDDVEAIEAAPLRAVADWLAKRKGWDVVHLAAKGFGFRSDWSEAGGVAICRAHLYPMTTPAQLWSREGARAFLDSRPNWPVDHALRRFTLSRRSGVAFDRPLVRLGGAESLITGRDALLTPAYRAKQKARRRWQRAQAAWHRLKWRMIGR